MLFPIYGPKTEICPDLPQSPLTFFSEKFHYYGIRGCALNWFQSYFSKRLQQVEYRGNLSSPCHLSHGVPQGSTLGPLLFLFYVNDFQKLFAEGKDFNVCR